MRSTDEVSTKLPDFGPVALADMPAMRPATLGVAVQRAMPGSLAPPVARVPAAAVVPGGEFSSSI